MYFFKYRRNFNFTYCSNEELVARDIGPGNVLLDEYLKNKKYRF